MVRIDRLILDNLTLRVFLPLLILALASTWYGLFASVDRFAALTGGLSFMDMQPWLTAGALFEQIRTYSSETVNFYIGWSLFDYFWPLLTFTTMLFFSGWLLGFLQTKWRPYFWMVVASADITVLTDWAENVGFVALLLALPAEPMWLARLTLGLHAGKLLFNMVFNVLFWVLLVTVIVIVIRKRISAASGNY